jgi:hypothetical protein
VPESPEIPPNRAWRWCGDLVFAAVKVDFTCKVMGRSWLNLSSSGSMESFPCGGNRAADGKQCGSSLLLRSGIARRIDVEPPSHSEMVNGQIERVRCAGWARARHGGATRWDL